ncbi:hypothetical protein IFM89_033727 [Coptis chinensis]|uniref:Uncharacterized protein n=1 Tax=Coptis chinensis TaxID=261450 RepID=A0A835LXZ5_9MAGN|nr:hypothetical protein IFM89_033727 [Coptis chinensis]
MMVLFTDSPRTLVLLVAMLFLLSLLAENGHGVLTTPTYSRNDFPPHFVFGSGTSAYQVEGAAAEDGRTPSIWDTVAHSKKSMGNGDIACDEYHKYKDDVRLMVDTGLDAYRFSISWSRLIPNGRGPVNPKGLQYYNNLINELVRHGTILWHMQMCAFREFGDRVSHWTTVNEVNVLVLGGYDLGFSPPMRCSSPFGFDCTSGNSTSEPYTVAHNCLLAHASAVRLYKTKYQAKHHGFIGLNLFSYWLIPLTNTTEDITATQRANDFYVGWFINPLVFGDYPDVVKRNAGSRLPSFTRYESRQVKSSYDFIGLNHYNTLHVKDNTDSLNSDRRDVIADMAATLIFNWDEVPAGEFPITPSGMQGVLEYFKQKYGNPPMFIHENGQRTFHNTSLNDTSRIKYLNGYIGSTLDAVRNGSNTRGFFHWSFLDLYELFGGNKSSYGLYFVDFKDPDLKRYPKLSAYWYSKFLKGGNISNNQGVTEAKTNIHTWFEASHSSQ